VTIGRSNLTDVIEPVHAPPLWEGVVERMRDAILSREIRPGTKLVEADLALRFGTSRGPIREAMRELVREGLIIEYPRRGNVVATLTAHDLEEVYGVREALEIEAARIVVEHADDALLRELERHVDAYDRGVDYLANIVHDVAFHRTLVSATDNARMTSINEQMLAQTAHLLHTAAAANPTLRSAVRSEVHRDILAALAAHDGDLFRSAIEAHYLDGAKRLVPALEWFDAGYGSW
jgi:DNA-binding GntR family transcriptional regulator